MGAAGMSACALLHHCARSRCLCALPPQGKTHTLTGTDADPGITPRAVRNLFGMLEASGLEFLVRVSYIEIYNEEVNDLLRPENMCLKVYEDSVCGARVKDLTEIAVCCAEEALGLLAQGNAFRHVSSTAMNAKSSRSHTLFRMSVETRGSTSSMASISEGGDGESDVASVLSNADTIGTESKADDGFATPKRARSRSRAGTCTIDCCFLCGLD